MILAIAIILIIILILACIMVIPFNILLKLDVDGLKINGYFKLTWMKLRLLQRKYPEKEGKEKKDVEKKEIKKEDKKQFDFKRLPRLISLIYQSLPYFMRIFNAFLKSTKFEKFGLTLKLGLSGPYDTAMISGYLYAIIPLMNLIPKVCIFFEPEFQKERLEATINLKIRIRLFWIIIELLRALTKKPIRSLINELRKMR